MPPNLDYMTEREREKLRKKHNPRNNLTKGYESLTTSLIAVTILGIIFYNGCRFLENSGLVKTSQSAPKKDSLLSPYTRALALAEDPEGNLEQSLASPQLQPTITNSVKTKATQTNNYHHVNYPTNSAPTRH
jgi:hypothetical protein